MYKLKVMFLAIATSCTGTAVASNDWFTPEKVSASLSAGLINGKARERVYSSTDGRKLSQLDWQYDNTPIMKGNLDWDLMPWVTLNASGWTTLASKGTKMDDYDWLKSSQEHWTDHSSHPDTKLNYANQFDLNLIGWILNKPEYRLGLMAGYQQSSFSWASNGGHYDYDNGTEIGDFEPGVGVIGYSQKFRLPYIGVTGRYRYQSWEVGGTFKFSNWGTAHDNDEHYLRSITFRTKETGQSYYGLTADVGYYLTDNAKIFIEGAWNRLLNEQGDMEAISNRAGGKGGYFVKAAGVEHTNYVVNAGLKYSF